MSRDEPTGNVIDGKTSAANREIAAKSPVPAKRDQVVVHHETLDRPTLEHLVSLLDDLAIKRATGAAWTPPATLANALRNTVSSHAQRVAGSRWRPGTPPWTGKLSEVRAYFYCRLDTASSARRGRAQHSGDDEVIASECEVAQVLDA